MFKVERFDPDEDADEEEEEALVATKKSKKDKKKKKKAKIKAPREEEDAGTKKSKSKKRKLDSEDEAEEPPAKRKKEETEDDEEEEKKKKKKKKSKKKSKKEDQDEEAEEDAVAEDEAKGKSKTKSKSKSKPKIESSVKSEPTAVAPPAADGEEGTRKVYMGGLPYDATEEEIREFFVDAGTVEAIEMINFADTLKFRGMAFVSFSAPAEAAAAAAMDGAEWGNRWLQIRLYERSKHNKPVLGEVAKSEGVTSIYCGNLEYTVQESTIRDFFKECGKITGVRFGKDKGTGEFKGFAHVDFGSDEAVEAAVAMNLTKLWGRPMKISYAKKPAVKEKKERRISHHLPLCFKCNKRGHKSNKCPDT